jgi:competence protein ComEA
LRLVTGLPLGGKLTLNQTSRSTSPVFLRSADQRLVASLIVLALLAMAVYWTAAGAFHGELVDIDQAEPLSARFRVDINTAPWPELAQLPGVGETLARRIVQSRQRHGPFRRHADIQRIHGMGPVLLERILPFLLPIPPER